MRDILFRGKRKDNGKWIEGYFVMVNPVDMPIRHRKPKAVIFPIESECNWFNKFFYHAIEVLPETVGQFTGLIDIRGNKIYEGDIHGLPGWIVTYCADTNESEDMHAGWYVQRDNWESWIPLENITEHEIIGNVHDTPELMEEE